jgi:assimilatory nitrate reductase catalytic subunit
MSRTGTIGRLFGQVPEPVVQMNEQDMLRRNLKAGDLVHVTSKRGSIILPLEASPEIAMSSAFIAMHWGSQFVSGRSEIGERLWGVNAITTSSYCPDSKQPEFKHAAVKILKADLPHSVVAVAWLAADAVHGVRAELQKWMGEFDFASLTPFGQETDADDGQSVRGLLLRAANQYAPAFKLVTKIESLLQLNPPISLPQPIRYVDQKNDQYRVVLMKEDVIQGFLLSGNATSSTWMQALLQEGLDAKPFRRRLLLPSTQSPSEAPVKAQQICSCLNVTEDKIKACLGSASGTEAERLALLQSQLHCGTQCGSCVPTLKRMVRETETIAL